MSVNGSQSGVTFGGLTSGIDTESIISRLVQLEQIPIQRIQTQQQQVQAQQSVYAVFKSKIQALSISSSSMNNEAAFNPISASSSNTDVATLTGSSTASAGAYNLAVSKLAKAQKVSSGPQTDTTTSLSLNGTIVINGHAIEIEATDTLAQVAGKISSASAGVTASLINGGTGNAYLTLTSNSTGLDNQIQMSDQSGSVLSSLGLISGAPAIRSAITNGAESVSFSSDTTTIESLMGVTGLGSSTFQINGIDVSVDPAVDTLQTIASKINAASTGATATVASTTADGKTTYSLQIAGASTPTFTDNNGFLGALGILQAAPTHELIPAQDAEFSLDGVSLTSSTNSVTTVIPGATLTLLKANETTPETSTLSLARDNSAVAKKIKDFVAAYNDTVGFVQQNSQFDKDTFQTGLLFGDPVAQQIESQAFNMVFNTIPGLSSPYNNLTSLGVGVDENGQLTVDDTMLTKAITDDPESVSRLFRARGTTSGADLTYIFSTEKTKASGAGSYAVNISQLATQSSYKAEMAQASPNVATETLTFTGSAFGSTGYQFVISQGASLAQTITAINNDAKLRDLVVASDDGGSLKITSIKYGTPSKFKVVSDLAAAVDNSGIGTASGGTLTDGLDVAGTINGETATGSGQLLTGADAAEHIAGLQVKYTGNTLGNIGSVQLTRGVGAELNSLLNTFTDSVNGLLTTADKSMQAQIDDFSQRIADLQDKISLQQQMLRERFAAMEEAISKSQSQAQRLSALNSK